VTHRRGIALAAGVLVWLALTCAPAAAVETSEFGIEPASGAKLEAQVLAGRTSVVPVRLWNQAAREIEVRLALSTASVAEDGTASLDGEQAPVRWAKLETRRVRLAEGEVRVIELRLHGPSRLETGEHTMAVIAQVEPAAGEQAAVIQRLAPIVYLHAIESVAPHGVDLGAAPWIAGVLVFATGGAAARRARKLQSASA
jgi:hypothetical protein